MLNIPVFEKSFEVSRVQQKKNPHRDPMKFNSEKAETNAHPNVCAHMQTHTKEFYEN